MRQGSRRTFAIVFAAILVGIVVLIAATSGIGGPDLPDEEAALDPATEGSVAFVEEAPEGEVTQEQYDAALAQAVARQQLPRMPEPGTPQYDLVQQTAMADLLLARWVAGEAEELGIEVAEREIDTELQGIIEQDFGGEQQFERFLEESEFSEEDARDRVELQILSERIQEQVVPTDPPISDDEITDFYEANIAQFETPETRDVRIVLTRSEEQAQEALAELEEDNSAANWKRVAQKFSVDEGTASVGGLREGVISGQNEPALDEAIFTASTGDVVGPIRTSAGYNVLQVENINEASTQELDEQTQDQIRQQLVTEEQQRIATTYQDDFLSKWIARTVCADDFVVDRCSNAPPLEDSCQGDDPGEEPAIDPSTGEPTEGCPAFVPSTRPVPPQRAGDANAVGLPQGPQGPPQPELGEAIPLGTPGAPTP